MTVAASQKSPLGQTMRLARKKSDLSLPQLYHLVTISQEDHTQEYKKAFLTILTCIVFLCIMTCGVCWFSINQDTSSLRVRW